MKEFILTCIVALVTVVALVMTFGPVAPENTYAHKVSMRIYIGK